MAKIVLLSDTVADQIAAGEVVENAASAVKELLENAIDAGASDIVVRIEQGGLERICVEDDGCGMDREDALLSLKRHATSKIRSTSDLEKLATMGFRGEALAALASVSKMELKTSDGVQACRVSLEGGGPAQVDTIARNRGTTIEIKSLFYNTPARLKFQKSASTNAAAVLKTVQTLSLAHPEVRFALFSNGKPTLTCYQTDWKLRVEEWLGHFAHEVSSPMIRGLLGRPEEGKATRSGQIVYINRRPVFSPLIAKAVKEGYGTRLQESLFPTFVLFLDLPPDWIDVNVHPQKREVRFREESSIFQLVRNAVFQAFETSEPAPLYPWESPFEPVPFIPAGHPIEALPFIIEDAPLHLPIEPQITPLALLGDFLLLQKAPDWQLLDLRGAEARIVFEQMEQGTPPMQPLLFPLEYETQTPEDLVEWLKEAHIEARVTGKRTIAIDATPQGLLSSHVLELVRELSLSGQRRVAAALTKTYRNVKRLYTMEEARAIAQKLSECSDQTYDPVGKKIITWLTKELITRMFS